MDPFSYDDLKTKVLYRKYPKIKEVADSVKLITDWSRYDFSYPEIRAYSLRKKTNQFMDYQKEEYREYRSAKNDRIFPLETVEIQGFRTKHDVDLENVIIHTGFSADEYARSFNALALTIGNDIFFRNGAYKPETEEGRKILAHELTHVAQHEEGRITRTTSVRELEVEAETAEKIEEYKVDPLINIEIEGEIFRIRESEMGKIAKEIAVDINNWLEQQKVIMNEESYLKLLYCYKEWLVACRT
jgi:hypothetical protein